MYKIVIYKAHKIYRYRYRCFQSDCASGSFLMMFHNREDEKRKKKFCRKTAQKEKG